MATTQEGNDETRNLTVNNSPLSCKVGKGAKKTQCIECVAHVRIVWLAALDTFCFTTTFRGASHLRDWYRQG